MLVILGILLTVFLGLLVSFLISFKMSLWERAGAAYLLGIGILTLFMFFLMWVRIKLTLESTSEILIVLLVIFFALTHQKAKLFFRELKSLTLFPRFSGWERVIVFVIICLLGYSLLSSLYWPIADWDALALYDFRAMTFVKTGYIDEGIRQGYFFGYPLLSSLANSWVYFLGGHNPKFIYSLFFISFVFMFYGVTRKFSSKMMSLIAVLFLATTPSLFSHSMIAYTNLPYAVYFSVGTIYLYLWMIKSENHYLFLSASMIGLSTWMRSSEPFWLVNLVTVVLCSLYKKKFFAIFQYGFLFFLIQQPWRFYESHMIGSSYSSTSQITDSTTTLLTKIDFVRMEKVIVYLYKNVVSSWQPLSLLFLVILALEVSKRVLNVRLLCIILANFLLLVCGTYVFTFSYSYWENIPGSAGRMSMFFLPLFLYYIFSSRIVQEFFSNKK